MKVILPRQDFQEALQAVATLTAGRTTKPILACVRLVADGEELELSATDGEAALRLKIPALAVKEKGEAVVPVDRLFGIIRELQDVEIALETAEPHCTIRGEGRNFRIFMMNPADFPPVAAFDDEPDLVVPGAELRRMIHLTLYAAARETSRYAINGVLWEKEGKKLFLVATDGRRLARAGGAVVEASSGNFQIIVPAKALNVLDRVFVGPGDGEPWTVDVKVTPNQVLLRSGVRVLSTVLVEGHFPKYQDVIPKSNDKRARLDREELIGAVRQAALLTTEESRAVKMHFEQGKLIITSQSPEQGDARIEIPISYDGEAIDIGFNPAFVIDALKVVPYDEIFIEMQESFRPGILCGEDKTEFLYVIMPVSLSN